MSANYPIEHRLVPIGSLVPSMTLLQKFSILLLLLLGEVLIL